MITTSDIANSAPIVLVFIPSVFLAFKMRLINITKMFKSFSVIRESLNQRKILDDNNFNISAIKAFFIQASATLGIGNISGALFALYFGGPGVAVWMLLTTAFLSIIKFCEIMLGVLYKETDADGQSYSGMFYVLKNAFVGKKYESVAKMFAIIYALTICVAVSSWSGFQLNQSVSVLKSAIAKTAFLQTILPYFAIIASVLILLGVDYFTVVKTKTLTNVLSFVVPAMVSSYAFLILWVISANYEKTPSILKTIVEEAFRMKSAVFGSLAAITVAIKRSVLATEAGIGTAAIPYANSNLKSATKNAFMSFFDAMLVAFVMSFGVVALLHMEIDTTNYSLIGIQLMGDAFFNFNTTAGIIFTSVVLCFGLTTLLGNSFYVKSGALFLNRKINLFVFSKIHIVVVFLVSFYKGVTLIQFIDLLNYLLLVPTIVAVLLLSTKVKRIVFEIKDHN